jgi:hypothetical protein
MVKALSLSSMRVVRSSSLTIFSARAKRFRRNDSLKDNSKSHTSCMSLGVASLFAISDFGVFRVNACASSACGTENDNGFLGLVLPDSVILIDRP